MQLNVRVMLSSVWSIREILEMPRSLIYLTTSINGATQNEDLLLSRYDIVESRSATDIGEYPLPSPISWMSNELQPPATLVRSKMPMTESMEWYCEDSHPRPNELMAQKERGVVPSIRLSQIRAAI